MFVKNKSIHAKRSAKIGRYADVQDPAARVIVLNLNYPLC